MSNSGCSLDAGVTAALRNRRGTTKDFFMDRLVNFSPLQLQNSFQTHKFFFIYYPPQRLPRPQSFVMFIYSTSTPLKNCIHHLAGHIGPATTVSILGAVMQNVAKAHKCHILFG